MTDKGQPDETRKTERQAAVEAAGRDLPAPLREASREIITRVWRERWGLPLLSIGRNFLPEDVEGLCFTTPLGAVGGLVTWARNGGDAEIVTVDSLYEGRGFASRLLEAAEAVLRTEGATGVRILLTNDNLRALRLFLRRGYRLVRLHLDAVEPLRRIKPTIPHIGYDRIPLRDMWEVRKDL